MSDLGLTHVALPVSNLDASIAFYEHYAQLRVMHRRTDTVSGVNVVWLSDRARPFVLVLIEASTVDHPFLPFAHLGVGCSSREEVDRLCHQRGRIAPRGAARAQGPRSAARRVPCSGGAAQSPAAGGRPRGV